MGRENAASEATISRATAPRTVVTLPAETEAQVERLARAVGGDLADVFQRALALFSVAVAAHEHGQRLAVIDAEGRVVSEVTGVQVNGE